MKARVILSIPDRPAIVWPKLTRDLRHEKLRIQFVAGNDLQPPQQAGEYQVVHRITGEVLARCSGDQWIYTRYMQIDPSTI